MEDRGRPSIRFTLNGQRYELTRAVVEGRLAEATPEVIRKHAVQVNGTWFPVMQAFERATGVSRADFISHAARKHLAALGFEVAGEIETRASTDATVTQLRPRTSSLKPQVDEEWHTEANVQAALVTALAADGWRILSVANTATKEHGVDVIASRDGQTIGVEVKGYPSEHYADPARAGETKRTRPSNQAGHWYAQAILAAMRLRGREPDWRSVIALPDFSRYRDLHAETSGSLDAALIQVWWINREGGVDRPEHP